MKQTDKQAVMNRLSCARMVTPTLAEGQPQKLDTVRDIETITAEIREAKLLGGEAILTIGQRLIEAKAVLPHGEWLPWLNERVEFSERTARRFMKLAREWTNRPALTGLGAAKALALLALPESEREEFLSQSHQVNGEEKTVIDMTSRELERAIKERDEARRAAEQAKVDAKAASESRASMEESLKTANELLNRANLEKEQAEASVAGLEKQLAELKAAPVEVAVMQVDQDQLDAARAEGEAARALELEKLQAELDKVTEAKQKADRKRKDAEAALEETKVQLERTAIAADPDVAKFEVYFSQIQEMIKKLRGLLLKARAREDQSTAGRLADAILVLSDSVRAAAK